MSGPTLGLGITASGVEQMRALAQATEQFDKALASLETRGAGAGTQQLSGLAALQSEVQKIRAGLGEATAGLRTDLAELKVTVEKAMSGTFTGIAKAASDGGKQVAKEVDKATADTEASLLLYKGAIKQVAVAMNNATGEFTKFNPASGLRGNLVQPLEAALAGLDKVTAQHMVTSAKLEQERLDMLAQKASAEKTMMDSAVAQFRAIRGQQLADQLAFESKQRQQYVDYLAEREARMAQERTMMESAVAQFRAIKATEIANQIEAEDAQKVLWVEHNEALTKRLAQEAAAMDAAVAQFHAIQTKKIADQVAFETEQKGLWVEHNEQLATRLAAEATMMDSAVAQHRAIRAADLADQIAFEGRQKALWVAEIEAAKEREASYAVLSQAGQLRRQLQARAQLDVGIPEAAVASQYGSTAAAAAAATSVSALRAEIEKLPAASGHGAAGAKTLSDALGSVRMNSGVAREGLAELDEALQGRFKNMAGTFVALLNRMGLGMFIFQPLTLAILGAASAAGAFAIAMSKGSMELSNFEKQATITGNAIGLSASGFTQMRDALASMTGVTRGAAAEALTEIAASGLVANENLKGFTATALTLERTVGIPVMQTVKHLEELAKSPVEASSKLNEQYHYLTATTYSQIKALVEKGREQDAANLAEETYVNAMDLRNARILAGQGYLERGWHSLGQTAKEAWDWMVGIGREDSLGDKFAKAAKAVSDAEAKIAAAKEDRSLQGTVDARNAAQALPGLKSATNDAFRRTEIEYGNTVIAPQQINAAERAREDYEKIKSRHANKTAEQKLQEEIDRARTTGKLSGVSEQDIADTVASIQAARDHKKGGGAGLASSIKGQGDVAVAQGDLYRALMDSNDTTPIDKLTKAEQQLIVIHDKLAAATDAKTKVNLRAAEVEAQAAVDKEKYGKQEQVQHDAWIKDLQAVDKLTAANDRSTDSIEQKTAQVAEENKHWGKNKTAIEQSNLAQDQLQLSEADASDTFDPKYIESLRRKTQAQADYVKQLQLAEVHAEKKKLNDAGLKINEDTTTLELELSVVGKTAVERDRIMASRKAEIDLAKELQRIDNLNADEVKASGSTKPDLEQQARDNAAKEAQNLARKQTLTEWQKLSDQIETTLTDAILNAVHNGGNAFKSLRDMLKQMFDNLVLRPIIQAVMAPVASQLGAFGTLMSGGSTPAAGGMSNTLMNNSGLLGAGYQYLTGASTGASGASLVAANGVQAVGGDGLGALIAGNGGWAGVGGAATSTGVAAGLGTTTTGAVTFGAVDTGLVGMGAATTEATVAAGATAGTVGTGIGAAATGVMAAIPVAGWIALAAVALYSIFSKKGGGPKLEGTYNPYNTDSYYTSNSADVSSAAHKAVTPIQQQYDALAKQFGVLNSDIKFGLGYSTDPKGTAPSQVQIGVGKGSTTLANLSNTNVGRDEQSLQTAIADLGSRAILTGLQKSNLGGKFGTWINSLDIPGMAADVLTDTMTRLNKIATERATLQQRLDASTGTALAKLNKQREIERANIDDVNKLMLEQVYAQEDLVAAGQKLLTAYNTQQQSVTSLQAYATSLRDWVTQAMVGDTSPLSMMEELTQAAQQFNDTLAKAQSGDTTAQGSLPGTATTYLTALKNTATSGVDYAMSFSKVASALTIEAASADSKATVMDQQLSVAKDQLAKLGLIDDSIQTFEQAWADFNNAQAAVDAATAAATASDTAPATPSATPSAAAVLDPVAAAWASAYGNAKDSAPQGIQGFASGGYHRGGARIVGEHGAEMEITGPSYIHDASATRRLLGGGQNLGDDKVAIEIRELRREMQAQVGLQNQLTRDFRELKNRGFPVTNSGDGVALNTHAV